jgi:hypothetical protein
MAQAMKANPQDDPKLIRLHAQKQLVEAVRRTAPPPVEGELPDVWLPGIEPPPVQSKRRRREKVEPDPILAELAVRCALDADLDDLMRF